MARYEDEEEDFEEDPEEDEEEDFEDRWESTPQYWKDRWEHYWDLGMQDRLGPKGIEYIRETHREEMYEHQEPDFDDYDSYDFDFDSDY